MGGKDKPIAETLFPYYVDVRPPFTARLVGGAELMTQVRDAAEAHYQAVVRQAQGRFLLSAGGGLS